MLGENSPFPQADVDTLRPHNNVKDKLLLHADLASLRIPIELATPKERRSFNFWQFPAYLLLFIGRMTHFKAYPKPEERNVLNLILGSSLYMLASRHPSELETYVIDIRNCRLVINDSARGKFALRTMDVEFTRNSINVFLLNNEELTDYSEMLGALEVYLILSLHPKVHATSEKLMNHIESSDNKLLKPSLFITKGLHSGLMNSEFSPLQKTNDKEWPASIPFKIPIERGVVVEELANWSDFTHQGRDLFKNETRLGIFLEKGHAIALKYASKAGLSREYREYFFLTTILHAVDHYTVYRLLKYDHSLSVFSKSTWDKYQARCFENTFADETLNFLKPNLIKKMKKHPIYGGMYEELSKIDLEYANVVTASIMY